MTTKVELFVFYLFFDAANCSFPPHVPESHGNSSDVKISEWVLTRYSPGALDHRKISGPPRGNFLAPPLLEQILESFFLFGGRHHAYPDRSRQDRPPTSPYRITGIETKESEGDTRTTNTWSGLKCHPDDRGAISYFLRVVLPHTRTNEKVDCLKECLRYGLHQPTSIIEEPLARSPRIMEFDGPESR